MKMNFKHVQFNTIDYFSEIQNFKACTCRLYIVQFNQDYLSNRWICTNIIIIWSRKVGVSQNDKLS